MKRWILVIFISTIINLLFPFATKNAMGEELSANNFCYKEEIHNTYWFDIESYKDKIAFLETGRSKNPYILVNRYGYMGKYQFSIKTLNGLRRRGLLKYSRKELKYFLNNEKMQEDAIDALIVHNSRLIYNNHLDKYIGKSVGGIVITMSGMLAASHLVGFYALKHYLQTNGKTKPFKLHNRKVKLIDGNGTSIKKYLKHFE